MDAIKMILDFTADIAWPTVALVIAVMFRAPLLILLEQIGSIAHRASKEPFDLQLGEKLKISFREAIERANPKTVEEAIKVAEKEVDRTLNIFEMLSRIPLTPRHKDLLLKVAKGGDDGICWKFKGPNENAPGRTMGFLIKKGLVNKKEDRYFVHPVVRDFIFEVHGDDES